MPEHQQTQQSTESKTTSQRQATPRIQAPSSHPMAIIQRARINPKSLTSADVLQLQQTIGNRAVGRLLSEIGLIPSRTKQTPPVQMQTIPEEEKEPLQGKITGTIQRQEHEEDEDLQMKSVVQRQELPEDKELLQGKFESKLEQIACPSCTQRKELEEEEPLQTKRENNTEMPDNLKAGVESLSGIDMSDVRVHYNSSKPAEVGALAYTQGTDIHVAPGQGRHLPHEAWHVAQQAQGRVRPTVQLKGVAINDDVWLEHEADVMGAKATEQIDINAKASCLYNERAHEGGDVKQLLKVPDDHVRGDLRHPENQNLFTPGTINDINTRLAPHQISTVSNIVLDQAIRQSRVANQMDYRQLSQEKVTSEKQMTNFLNKSSDDEHMYVLDAGELHVAIRAESQKLPHPTLVGGDPDVKCAGTLRYESGEVVVTCSSGHFRPPTEGEGKKHVAKMMKKTAKKSYIKPVKGKRR